MNQEFFLSSRRGEIRDHQVYIVDELSTISLSETTFVVFHCSNLLNEDSKVIEPITSRNPFF